MNPALRTDLGLARASKAVTSRSFRLALIFALSVTESISLGLLVTGLPVLLRRRGASMSEMSVLSMLMLPWAFKMLWAPFVDKLGARSRFGRYRAWIVATHLLLCLTLAAMAVADVPGLLMQQSALAMAALVWLSLVSATADTATLGLIVNMLPGQERGIANGIQNAGALVGLMVGSGIVVMLVDWLGWSGAMLSMAGLVLVPLLGIALHQERPLDPHRAVTLHELLGFVRQPRIWRWIAILVALWSFPSATLVPFTALLSDRNLSLSELGFLSGVAGNGAGAICGALGGVAVARYGRQRAFYALGFLTVVSMVLSLILITRPASTPVLSYLAVIINTGGVAPGVTMLFVMMMDRSRHHLAGSDYSIQFSLMQLGGLLATGAGGFLADRMGSTLVFILMPMLTLGVLVASKRALDGRDFQPSHELHEELAATLPPTGTSAA